MPINVFGRQVPTGVAATVGIGGVGIAGYMVYRYKKQQKQAAAVSSSGQGYGYGAGYGYNQVSPYGMAGFGSGYGRGYYGEFGYGYGSFGPGGIPTGIGSGFPGIPTGTGSGYGTPQPETQQQWIVAATAGLEKDGYSPAAVQNALGRWLLGLDLTTDQVSIVSAAIGVAGDPPGNVPPVKTKGGGDGQNGHGGNKVTVPSVTGFRVETATAILSSDGLKATFAQRRPDIPYSVTSQAPKAGKLVNKGSTVHLSIKADQKAPMPVPRRG